MSHSPVITDEADRQRVLDQYHIVDSLPEDAYQDIVRIASTVCDTPIALITLLDRDRQWFKAQIGLEDIDGTPRDQSVCDHAIRDPDTLLEINDLREDVRFASMPYVTDGPEAKFYAGMPMVTPEGAAIGAVCVLDTVPRELEPRQRDALQSLARLTVKLFEGHHHQHQAEREAILAQAQAPQPVATVAKGEAASVAGGSYSVVIMEVQNLAALVEKVGERTLERTLMQLDELLKRCIDESRGDTLDRVTGSGEFIAVLNGDDVEARLRQLQDLAREQSEIGTVILLGQANAKRHDERAGEVFLRADASLSAAKDAYRRLPAH